MANDVELRFLAPPASVGRAGSDTSMMWTPEAGFVGTTSSMSMTETANAALVRFLPEPGPRRQRAPGDLAALVERATGISVSDAIIDRSPESGERATSLGAVAFTERGTVHLPAELGELTDPATRAVIAHELTHVAQQRAFGAVPAEESDEGHRLEAEARQVQWSVGGAVRPHFIRRSTKGDERASGVQRLAADDPYAWQQRDDDPSPTREGANLGLNVGYSTGARSTSTDVDRNDPVWAQEFESRHRDRLQSRRNDRYHELLDEALRQKQTAALSHTEVIAARTQLDQEMPWEFGPPARIDPYDGVLPPETDAEAEVRRRREALARASPVPPGGGHSGDPRAARRPPVVARAVTHAPTSAGAYHFGAAHPSTAPHGTGSGHGRADTEGTPFDWQHRQPTEHQQIDALFGGGLFGDILGLAARPETESDRRRAEETNPQLNVIRQQSERELRHAALRGKLIEATRTETVRPDTPLQLSHDDIVAVREQVDEAMPLEFMTPKYLDAHIDAQINAAGEISNSAGDAPATLTPTTNRAPGAAPPAPGASAHDAIAVGPSAPQHGPAPTPTADDHSASGSAVRTGATAVAAAALEHRVDGHRSLSEHEGAHDDEWARHEAAAGHIFAAASELDIDALSRRIWGRIRREMRSELLVDRERAGVLADAR